MKSFDTEDYLPDPPYQVMNTFIQLASVTWKRRQLGVPTHHLACETERHPHRVVRHRMKGIVVFSIKCTSTLEKLTVSRLH